MIAGLKLSFFTAIALLGSTLSPLGSLVTPAHAADEFQVPALSSALVDEAGWLSASDRTRIEAALREIHRQGKAQMAVYIPASLQGLEIEQASLKVAEAWKLGKKGTDRGVLLIVAPKERKMRLEVGYGLEGDLTDALSRRILDTVLKPLLRDERPGDAIYATVLKVGQVAGADLSSIPDAPSAPVTETRSPGGHGKFPFIFLIPIVLFFLARSLIGSLAGLVGGGLAFAFTGQILLAVIAFIILSSLFGGGRRRSGIFPFFGGFGGGGGGFGGGGGGGFGGFGGGGGGFGGGGSSSNW